MVIKKILFNILAVSVFFGSVSFFQNKEESIQELFEERGELYFKFDHPGYKLLTELSGIISIDQVSSDQVYAYANEDEFILFTQYGLFFEPLTPPSLLYPAIMKSGVMVKGINDWDFYPTYDTYVDMMYQFEEDYPELCTVFSIGQSVNGRELLFAKISDNIDINEGEPQFLYTGTMHGDETAGYVLSLRLIDHILSNYGTDPKIDNLVNNLEIWINPLANPDGTFAGGNNTVNGATRFNANGVDLNRNYPDPEDGPHPDGNEWQQETLMFMELAENNQFVASSNFHGGAEVCNYPWDTWAQLHADDNWWQYVCHEYADTAQAYSPNGYMSGYNDGITNGFQWYTINGGRQDYMNYFHQCREFTLELSDTKLPPASQLPDFWEYNYRSMLNFMEQTLYGISGTVTDEATGDPVYAEVFIENHDTDSSWVYTYELNGKYYRPLYEGTYDVTFSAFGYYPQTIEDVSIENGTLTILHVQLENGELIADFTASNVNVPVGSAVDFTDLTFGTPITWEWTFEGGTPASSSTQHPQGIIYDMEGSFDVSLTVSDGTNSQTVLKEDYITISEDFLMQNETVTTCSGIFYDTGGADNNYSNNENFTMTFLPGEENAKIMLEFISFFVEYESDCDYDWLKIYDGSNTSAPLIGKFCGTTSPGTIVASNEEGALTFEFHSDFSLTESGWMAIIGCESQLLPPVANFIADLTWIIEGETVSFNDLSTNDPETWEWVFEGGSPPTSNEQDPDVTYDNPGVFDVALTVTNSAGSNTLTKEDYITVDQWSAVDGSPKKSIHIFPNPASELITIRANSSIKLLKVYSITGEEMLNVQPEKEIFVQQLGNLMNGIYILTIQTEDQVIRRKLKVQK